MERKSERFQIPVKGLALGNHHFDFVVEDAFFEQYPLEEIHHGNIKLQLDVEKESRLMTFQFHFNGNLQLTCDRCLENYSQPLQGDFRLIVKYGDKEEELSEELMTIPFETSRFDIAPYILEFIQLMLPIKHVHPDDAHGNSTCDPEMLKELEKFEKQAVDPRWAALRNVKIK